MLSTANHPYTSMFNNSPSTNNNNFASGNQYFEQIQSSRVAGLAEHGSHGVQRVLPSSGGRRGSGSSLKSPARTRHHPYENAHAKTIEGRRKSSEHGNVAKDSSAPVRRRISRACDQCNQLRTKCDGGTPCAHCVGMLGVSGEKDIG